LKFVGLGIAIWSLSLLWPQVNRVLTPPVMVASVSGLGAGMLAYVLYQHLGQHNDHGHDQGEQEMSKVHLNGPEVATLGDGAAVAAHPSGRRALLPGAARRASIA
jgi:hypothetical protein